MKHWIHLILAENIVLPKYQRHFVWKESKVVNLITTFKDKRFVPPITIGAFKSDDGNMNYILDGQQRLTSIFLAYVGLFPDETIFRTTLDRFASEQDEEDDLEDAGLDNILKWNFKYLTEKGSSKEEIVSKVLDDNYKRVSYDVDDEFFSKNFLGFSYLVPHVTDPNQQQKYYSSVFRNINIQGISLLPQESRASLYFLDRELESFFKPSFSDSYVVQILSNRTKLDFVRYLSLLAHFHKNERSNQVARGYKPKMEKYYEEYIFAVINNEDSPMFGRFSDIIPDRNFVERFERLTRLLSSLGIPNTHNSIIDLDIYFFGLIYYSVFKDDELNSSDNEELIGALVAKIEEFKRNDSHRKSPNNLGHLRNRISQSVQIYSQYVSQQS